MILDCQNIGARRYTIVLYQSAKANIQIILNLCAIPKINYIQQFVLDLSQQVLMGKCKDQNNSDDQRPFWKSTKFAHKEIYSQIT